jgi:FAD/FMN-containing dehydrogenase
MQMKKIKPRLTRGSAIAALVLASTGLVVGQKARELAADPVGEKECAPLVLPAEPGVAGSSPPAASVRALDLAAPASLRLVSTSEQPRAPRWAQQGGTLNDASCLNRTPVHGIVRVTSVDDITGALAYARSNNLKVSIAGVRHSMGGQAFSRDAVVLDMTGFNQMDLDAEKRVLTVQSGATWHDIQNLLHPRFAVKAMQSTDIFSVGGSIAVNAHGMDHRVGALGKTVRSMRVMLPDGSIQRLSRSENRALFDLVIGGYGLLGIILDVELDITNNAIYETERQVVDYQAFPELWRNELEGDERLGLFYGHLSTSPGSLLREMILYTYREVGAPGADVPPLGEVSSTKLRRLVLNFSKYGALPMRLKWFAEKHIEPRMESCTVNRNQAMKDGEACLVSRNEPMHDSVKYLKNNLRGETDILQEYFIPRDQFVPFVDRLREIIVANDTNLLNASVRVVHQEDNFLNYAPAPMFAVVLYVNQPTTPEGSADMAKVTREIIDLTTSLGGRFFLPYQLHYSPDQLRQSYPEIGTFFAAKRRYDPEGRLSSTFYERYARFFTAEGGS